MPTCTKCQSQFEVHPDEQKFCAQLNVPEPTQCPECRLIRRLLERNARKLYPRTCDFSGKKIISTYHENQKFPVYDYKIWWKDDWDPMDYGQDFDFNRPFFEQFNELQNKVPHMSVYVVGETLQNSDYTNCAGYLKNCYLISEADYDEDCQYSNRLFGCNNISDCSNCYDSELLYECTDCIKCYNLQYSQESENCQDSYFLKNCIGCKDCIGCINQRHKQYMIFNKQYSKEEYEQKKAEIALETPDNIKKFTKEAKDFFKTQPHKATQTEHNENVIGDHVYNSKNAFYCYDCKDIEDCRYCTKVVLNVKNCMDYTAWGMKAELVYQSACCGDNAYNLKFCSTCTTNNSNLEYCYQCTGGTDLFGCIGLKKKKFCILNKQYTEEEFKTLRDKIVEHMKKTGEWGQFFPLELCPYGYNETLVMDHFPLTKEEALAKGYRWSDYEPPPPKVEKTIPANELPENIKDVTDDILNHAIICEVTKKPFKITKQELTLYRKMNIPCPHKHPDQRHTERLAKRPLYKLNKTACSRCHKDIFANVTPSQPKEILCKKCYAKEVY